jgi:predicted transcriptional regulator
MTMARTQTMVQLTDDLVDLLDQEAARRGASRSAVIRDILESALAEHREAELGRRIAEGYRRIPPGTPDEWGSLDDMSDHATADLLARLDREEAEAGLEPW